MPSHFSSPIYLVSALEGELSLNYFMYEALSNHRTSLFSPPIMYVV